MTNWIIKGACALTVLGACAALAGFEEHRHPTGADPVDHALYAKLPKVQRHRAWLPQSVDLSDEFPAPGDQGIESDCVEWATVYAARSFLHSEDIGHRPTQPSEIASPAYIYNRLRPAGSTCAVHTQMIDALNMLKTDGVVSVAEFPDDWRKCRVPAPDGLKQDAGALRIDDWRAVDRETPNDWRTPLVLDDVKGSLARGVPVVFAMPVADDFEHWKGDGVYHHDQPENINWHAMALVGYDETRQAFRLINSWGTDWGDHGYAWIDYDTFKRLAGEAYAVEGPVKATPPPISLLPAQSAEDQIRALAGSLPCSATTVRTEAGHPVVEGFAGVGDALDTAHASAMKLDPQTQWRVDYHPWPQFEAETTLAAPLRGSGVTLRALTEDGQPRSGEPVPLHLGERFGIVVDAPADRPYLDVIYLQADGSAVELYRGTPAMDGAGRRVALGVSGTKQARFEVAPPLGDEILIALASDEPLFGSEPTSYATERQFLTALRARLATNPHGGVSAAVLRLKTSG